MTKSRQNLKRTRGYIGTLGLFLLITATTTSTTTTSGFQTAIIVRLSTSKKRTITTANNFQNSKFALNTKGGLLALQNNNNNNEIFHHDNSPIDELVTTSVNQNQNTLLSRRVALQSMAATAGVVTSTAVIQEQQSAIASVPEIDNKTGNLFTPKTDMLSGGSTAVRGISTTNQLNRPRPQPGETIQSIYETRFVAYLSRFLLNFDPSARAYWVQQGFGYSWDEYNTNLPDHDQQNIKAENAFSEFAESVEVGLADYFSGPFGSYSSIQAAIAGINAAQPAKSKQTKIPKKHNFLNDIFNLKSFNTNQDKKRTRKIDNIAMAEQGILNLYALLKARYNTVSAKRQLAILFSFVTSPALQPVNEIKSLLGEADNATISNIRLVTPKRTTTYEQDFRLSSRTGGGYSIYDFPEITVTQPPPLGDKYHEAEIVPIMAPTSRVLRITLEDGGEGYKTPPTVTVIQRNGIVLKPCQAITTLDRNGRVEDIIILDPGYGYGGRTKNIPPVVRIDAPPKPKGTVKTNRRARAYAELEYKITKLELINGGNGFVSTEPPLIKITLPKQDPDWFLNVQEQPSMRMYPVNDIEPLRGEVIEMIYPDGNIAYTEGKKQLLLRQRSSSTIITDDLLERISRDPLELLPSSVRPELIRDTISGKDYYSILKIADIPQYVAKLSPRYRACDPLFGGVGRLPVTKGATALTFSEYARLALSGAVCTVVVRTALNPLELIKTKQQLQNDQELFDYARSKVQTTKINPSPVDSTPVVEQDQPQQKVRMISPSIRMSSASNGTTAVSVITETNVDVQTKAPAPVSQKLGTVEMIKTLVELRGPFSLFQSADITFLASLVFGSFGFGATELFRRSFSEFFFTDDAATGGGADEIVLLLAAGLATVLTAAAASPFEVLRVRSMGLIEEKKWTEVLKDFLEEKRTEAAPKEKANKITFATKSGTNESKEDFNLRTLKPQDLVPLWSGFAPILSRELPFAIAKFLTFDLIARATVVFLNSQADEGALPIQIGVGTVGLTVSAAAGAIAGIAGAIVSHPADLILTKTSAAKRNAETPDGKKEQNNNNNGPAWVEVIKDLISQDGGISNLFVGLGSRSIFFFLVIGLQFFLYDYVKNLFQVGSDDLSLVLDIFYAVRAGLADAMMNEAL